MNAQVSENTQALPPGTRLEEFVIERVLGSGGFGITYLARDVSLNRQVVIKENLPAQFAWRDSATGTVRPRHSSGGDADDFQWSMNNFLREAETLASLDHPGIVRVLRKFEANGTAYFVMPFVEGIALDELVAQRQGAPFTEEELRGLLERVLSALGYLHDRGIYHRDIKPGNILITSEGIPVLIDFGSARQRLSERSMTVIESAGYTPFEQLQSKGNVGPWSDLYALGATMEKILTGEAPPKAMDRMRNDPRVPLASRRELKALYGNAFLAGIDKSLEVEEPQRWQNATEWLASLQIPAQRVVATDSGHDDSRANEIRISINASNTGKNATSKANPVPWIIAACVIVLLAVWAVISSKKTPPGVAQAQPSASPTTPSDTPPARPDTPRSPLLTEIPAEIPPVVESKPDMVALITEIPPELIEGKPRPINVPNLKPPPTKAPELFVPAGTVLLSKGKPVTSSDDSPIIGDLTLVTDGEKEAGEGFFMEILDGLQWVQIDLEQSAAIHAIWIWHFHSQKRAYHDVIVQISDDPEFRTGVTIVFNNDYDNSAKLGKGGDAPYVETRFGKAVDGKGTQGRYVRLYSNGSTSNEMNHYIEVEVFGIPFGVEAKRSAEVEPQAQSPLSSGEIGDGYVYDIGSGEKIVIRYVPGGRFQMGSPRSEKDREDDETQVWVTLSSHYWMGETEVTQGQWQAVMGNNPSEFRGAEDWKLLPVESVSWNDAQEFITKLNETHPPGVGWKWTLPTEAQWERACRGGTTTATAFGDSLGNRQANFEGTRPYGEEALRSKLGKTAPVTSYEPNAYGLYDMHGNVCELCADWFGAYQGGEVTDPLGASSGSFRVYRGGGWDSFGSSCRSASRSRTTSESRYRFCGFRLAVVPTR